MTDFKKTLGKKIVLARKGAAMSQRTLAAKLKITQQALSGYERGAVSVSVEILAEICRVLDAPVSWFMPNVKQYGEIIGQTDIELLTELHKLAYSETLLGFVKAVKKQSNVKKTHGLTVSN